MSDSIKQLNEKLLLCLTAQGTSCEGYFGEDGKILTDLLIADNNLTSSQANTILENSSGFPAIDPGLISFSPKFLDHVNLLFPSQVLHDTLVFPIKQERDLLHIVMADPLNQQHEKSLESWSGSRLKKYSCNSHAVKAALDSYFPLSASMKVEMPEEIVDAAVKDIYRLINDQDKTVEDLINNARVIRLLRLILTTALEKNASDIHFEPQLDFFRVRARLDGVLHTLFQIDKVVHAGIMPRIKMTAGMEIERTKTPQDGRIDYHIVQGYEVDIRCSVLPTLYGEKAVLRILDKGKKRIRFSDFDLEPKTRESLNGAIRRPNGLVLVAGPTGSGKSTTLYAFLEELNSETVNIITAEDPVEYELDGIIQVPCDPEKGVGFADALRSFLRQDPDIIMVGEIRDYETADIAVKAALTGHLVFSTLHTNDAPGTITRIINLGVTPLLLSSCGLTVVAQRLIRTICNHCKEEYIPDEDTLKALELEEENLTYHRGGGCSNCSGTGYRGRVSIMEVLVINEEIERLILEQRPVGEIKSAAIRNGMRTLREDALERLIQGSTSPEEVLRVTIDA